MRTMKKFMTIIGMLTCIFAINICQVNAAAKSNQLEYKESDLKSEVDFIVNSVLNTFDDSQITQFLQAEPEEIETLFSDQVGIAIDGAGFKSGLQSWNEAKAEFGEFQKIDNYKYSADENEVVVTANITGSEGKAVLTVVFDKDLKISSMSTAFQFSLIKSLERMVTNHYFILLLVIFILIFISYILIIFLLIKIYKNKKVKTEIKEEASEHTIAQIIEKEELVDDYELVAVISAAIAAYTGTSEDGFVVRSIKRSNKSNWKKS